MLNAGSTQRTSEPALGSRPNHLVALRIPVVPDSEFIGKETEYLWRLGVQTRRQRQQVMAIAVTGLLHGLHGVQAGKIVGRPRRNYPDVLRINRQRGLLWRL